MKPFAGFGQSGPHHSAAVNRGVPMQNKTLTAIVTHYVNYRESDRILTLFSLQSGRADVKAEGCRRPKSRLLTASQPFVYGEFVLFKSRGKYSLNSCEVRESFYPIRDDYDKFAAGSAMLSLCNEAVQPEEPNEPLFSLLYHSLSFLSYGSIDAQDLMICFLIRYLNIIGFCPSVTKCANCGKDVRTESNIAFSPEAGGALCALCSFRAEPISSLALEAMRRIILLDDKSIDRVRLPEKAKTQLWPHLLSYVRHVLGHPVKSLTILSEHLK
ncbi:MAG: DNA repair protein RecO [Firmicutes bacterium ADurb.Bin182]|nr:MAG: DNA repair protein RecO [Firmicutes bacterium ADurb.Bin182]